MDELVAYVEKRFNDWADARKPRESIWEECYYNTLSQYTPARVKEREAKPAVERGSDAFVPITAAKVHAVMSIYSAAFTGFGFELEPQPDTDDASEELMEELDASADKAEEKITRWLDINRFIEETLPLAALDEGWCGTSIWRGPTKAVKTSSKPTYDEQTGNYIYGVEQEEYPLIQHVSPWNFYPDPDCLHPDREGFGFIIRHKMDPAKLKIEAKALGWDKEAVKKILEEDAKEDDKDPLASARKTARKDGQSTDGRYPVLELCGLVEARLLKAAKAKRVDVLEGVDDDDFVESVVYVCGGHLLGASVSTWYPETFRGIFTNQWDPVPETFWGVGPAEKILAPQKIINGTNRLILQNKALSGNCMFEIVEEWLVPGQDYSVHPGKKWRLRPGATGAAIRPVIIPDITGPLFDYIAQQISIINTTLGIMESSGLAQSSNQAGGTATGMAILTTSANESLKERATRRENVILATIEAILRWNNEFGDDPEAKVLCNVKSKGINTAAMERQARTLRLNAALQALPGLATLPAEGPKGTALEGIDLKKLPVELFKALELEGMEIDDSNELDTDEVLSELAQMPGGEAALQQIIALSNGTGGPGEAQAVPQNAGAVPGMGNAGGAPQAMPAGDAPRLNGMQ